MSEERAVEHDVDERVLTLAGDAAPLLTNGPRITVDFEPNAISAGLAQGAVCQTRAQSKRILVYSHGGELHAIVTILAHGGYRRKFKKVSSTDAAKLVELMQKCR